MPFKMYAVYILFTLLLSFYGPMKYIDYDKLPVLVYILFFLFCLFIGQKIANNYRLVLRKKEKKIYSQNEKILIKNKKRIEKFVKLSINLAFFSIFIEFLEVLITNPSSLDITNIANNYFNINLDSEEAFYSIPILIRFATGFFRNVAMILGIYYWKFLKTKTKVLLLSYFVLLVLVNMVAYGTQKFLGDIVIYTVIVLAMKMLDSSRSQVFKIIRYSILLVMAVLIIYTLIQAQRYETIGITVENYGARSDGMQYFDENHLIFRILGDRIGLGLAIILTGYLSAGYYGLSLTFQLPFVWTYGIGNSYFMSKLLAQLLNIPEIYEKTYLNRMTIEFGRDGLRTWSTIFPWLASDFTFIGTLFIFIIIGYIWQLTWLEIIKYRNPVSLIMFSVISLGLIFVPANNQLLNSIDTFIATFITVIYWIGNHKKYNYR